VTNPVEDRRRWAVVAAGEVTRLLASACLDGVSGNLPEVTGARRPILLGKVSERWPPSMGR
jgi:hypothetical protein